MARSAKVTSIDVLPLVSAALQKFRGEAAVALDDLEIELRRIIEWIHHDRKQYWTRQRERAYENLNQARLQLQQAKISRRIGDHEAACVEEKRAVDRAKRRLETAYEKIETVRRWTVSIDRAVDDFQRSRTQFAFWLETDLQRAIAALNQMSESLVSYISLETPADPSAPIDLAGDNRSADAPSETPPRDDSAGNDEKEASAP